MKSHLNSMASRLSLLTILSCNFCAFPKGGIAQNVDDVNGIIEITSLRSIRMAAVPQSVFLSADRNLNGQVQILGSTLVRKTDSLNLRISSLDGKLIEAKTDDHGYFTVQGLEPGVYSIFGRSGNVVVCQSIRVFENLGGDKGQLSLFAASPTPEIEKLIRSTKTSTIQNSGDSLLPGSPNEYVATNGRVAIDRDGVVKGGFWSTRGKVKGTEVTIYQNGIRVARTFSDETGGFQVKLVPGAYTLVASGTGGIAVVGFMAVSEPEAVALDPNPKSSRFVSLVNNSYAMVLNVGLAPAEDSSSQDITGQSITEGSTNFGSFGGGGSGGGNGGSGGGGGLGGGRGFLGLGAGVAGLAVGISNKKDAPIVSASGQ